MDKVIILAKVYDEKGFIGFSVFNYSDYRIYITNNLKNYDIWGLDIINSKPEYKGYREIPKYYLNMNYLDKYQGVVLGRMADKIISFNYLVGFQSLKEIDFIKFSLKNGIDFVNVDFIACNTKVRSIYGKLPSIDVNRFTRKTLTFINEIELSKQRDRKRLKIQVERQKAINEAVTLTNSEFKYLNTSIPKNEKQRQKQIDDRKNWFFISELMYNFDEIMKNELDFLKKDKKTMFQINRPIDSTNLRKELLNFDPFPCIEIICKNIVKEALKIVDCNISREKKIEELSHLFNTINIDNTELCEYCLTMLKLEGIVSCLNDNIYGLVIGDNESIFIDVSKVKRYEIPYIQECCHEYIHYLTTRNGRIGFIDLDNMDNSVKNIQTFFTEGFTELLSFYLTYQVIKSYYNSQSKRLYSNGKVVTLVDLEKYYLPMLSDLKHLKKFRNIEDSIKDFESTPKGSHIVGWKNSGYYINLYVLFYILQKIGIEFGIDCFYNNNFEKFNQKCVSVFGYNWIKVTDFIKLDRNLSDFKIVANILKLLEGR